MKETKLRYGFVGAGAIGGAIGGALQHAGCEVKYYDRDKKLSTVGSLDQLAKNSDVIFLCVPSWVVSDVTTDLSQVLGAEQVVITVAKGVYRDFVTMDDVLKRVVGKKSGYGLLYGPMLASEIRNAQPGYGLLALQKTNLSHEIARDLSLGHIYAELTDDIHSVALCGALKNIYAVGFGIHDGLGFGANTKGALLTRSLIEMEHIVDQLEGDPLVVLSVAGAGDLLATGWGDQSFNHRVGQAIALSGMRDDLVSEGIVSLREVSSKLTLTQYPILNVLYRIVQGHTQPETFREVIDV
ncbi:NAD(P)-binding domain-containing protein [bacterium]|nr:NAD(P)-binding domain-containing protein [bacterium]